MWFLPITEPSKIGSVLTSFTRHGCLMFQRKQDRARPHAVDCQTCRSAAPRTFLSQISSFDAWLGIFLRFKAYSAYLRCQNETSEVWSVGKVHIHPHMLGINRKLICHSGRYVTERIRFLSSGKGLSSNNWSPDCREQDRNMETFIFVK